ncbi:10283_t:CDS:2, partial [Gigaspora margarita]
LLTGAPVQSKITKKRSSQHKQSMIGQQNSKRYSTSPFQTSRQLLESCDNSAAINKKENASNTDFSIDNNNKLHQVKSSKVRHPSQLVNRKTF